MTNINCTKKCCFQKDGKCSYDSVKISVINQSVSSDCPYQSEFFEPSGHEDMQL